MDVISVTRKGVERLVDEVNKLYGGELIVAEHGPEAAANRFKYSKVPAASGWFICIGGRLHHLPTTLEAIRFLQGVKVSIGLSGR